MLTLAEPRAGIVLKRALLKLLLLGSATTRGARWAHARRDRSVTAARAERKGRCRAEFSSVATQHRPRNRVDARVSWLNSPSAVAVCFPKRGRESATDSAICRGIGSETARISGIRPVSADPTVRRVCRLVHTSHPALSNAPACRTATGTARRGTSLTPEPTTRTVRWALTRRDDRAGSWAHPSHEICPVAVRAVVSWRERMVLVKPRRGRLVGRNEELALLGEQIAITRDGRGQ
jgi:hypothetical protein